MRPDRRPGAKNDVGREERAEEHHFRREEQPDPELAVGQSGVGARFDGVRDVHYARSGSNCGGKSLAAPGTLYSYGPRYTMGSVRKLPCPGGDGADHSSVVASHGLSDTGLPFQMLQKKLKMNGIWTRPRVHAAMPIQTCSCSGSPWLCAY